MPPSRPVDNRFLKESIQKIVSSIQRATRIVTRFSFYQELRRSDMSVDLDITSDLELRRSGVGDIVRRLVRLLNPI